VKATNKILDFILDVADQTKLLGLNAAILAAQAGAHGRGFGVVAGEIRKLAANSASSVEQITSILKNIRTAIAKVSSSSSETSAISTEQSRSVQDITQVVENIRKSVNLLVASVGSR
jgi:methyl-accepting chemotaxis protein